MPTITVPAPSINLNNKNEITNQRRVHKKS